MEKYDFVSGLLQGVSLGVALCLTAEALGRLIAVAVTSYIDECKCKKTVRGES